MRLMTFREGNNAVTFFGASALRLDSLPWYNSDKIVQVITQTPNGLGWVTGEPGNMFGVTTMTPPTGTELAGYIFVCKKAFTLDDAPFRIAGNNAPVTIDIDGTVVVAGETVFDASDPATGFASPFSLTAAFSQGSGTIEISIDDKKTWAPLGATPYALGANTFFVTRVRHMAGTPFYATITATF